MKQVYDEYVPTKLSEKEFWKVSHCGILAFSYTCTQKYFQSQYFHRDRLAGTTINVAERDIFDRCAEVRTQVAACACDMYRRRMRGFMHHPSSVHATSILQLM